MPSQVSKNAIAERIRAEMDAIELLDLLSSSGANEKSKDDGHDVVLTTEMLKGMAAEITRTSYVPAPARTRNVLRYQVGIAALVAFALGLGAFVLVQNRALAGEGDPAAQLVSGAAVEIGQPSPAAEAVSRGPVVQAAEESATEEEALSVVDEGSADSASSRTSGRARDEQAPMAPTAADNGDVAIDDNPYENDGRTVQPAPAPVASNPRPDTFEQRVDQMIASALEGPKKDGARQAEAAVNTLPQDEQTIPQRPTRQEVRRSLGSLLGSIRACGGETYDRLVVKLTVDGETGRVTAAETVDATYAGTPVGSCAARVARLAKFPRFAQSEIVVKYPFEL